MKTRERERDSRDSIVLMLFILLLGFICIILSSGWALRFAPSWRFNSNMGSNLNPNSDFLTNQPVGFFEPIDPSILTNPAWIDVFLTPGASYSTPEPPRSSPISTFTPMPQTSTSTSIPFNPTKTQTSIPTSIIIIVPTTTKTRTPPTSGPTPTRTATGVVPPTFTFTAIPTATFTATATPTPTNTPGSSADLQITKTDNATDYAAGMPLQYTIVVSNAGPSNVISATVADTFPSNLDPVSITWTCAGSGGASCTGGGVGNINDTFVNLPAGTSVTYTVNATVIASPSGPLVNTATVNVPVGISDPTPGNNSATDTDQLIIANSFPYGGIGTSPDGVSENIPTGTYIVLQFGTPLVVGSGQYLVYYLPPSLQVDAVILQVGDGSNWYTVFNWGNGSADANTDASVPLPVPPNPTDCSGEPDQCVIDSSLLTNSPGITINVNALPPGSYPYIRIISPPNPPDTGNNGVNVDAIAVLP